MTAYALTDTVSIDGPITGTVSIDNVVTVTGSVTVAGIMLSGSIIVPSQINVTSVEPFVVAGRDSSNVAHNLLTDVSGALYVTTSGSFNVNVVNFPAIQTVTGTVNATLLNWPAVFGVTSSAPLTVFNPAPVGVTGSVSVSGSVTAYVTVSGSTGLMVAAPPGAPVWVTGSVGVDNISISSTPKSTAHTTSAVTASLTSQVVLFANPLRLGATFFNTRDSMGSAFLCLGSTATTSSFLIELNPREYYSLDTDTVEAVSVIFDTLPGTIMVTEQT